ncbi:hypothetical protein D9619_004853 [Psilocybe cf. subviscida]|uniref:Uncharacterized protein n=1 Tax=Psilocybe cf. subviscida TaxID=2480587 RepID=A0A8H5BQT0_9AGAR|nr:hypothetical protein D9619_004853 [Psilocybe cf. subviscida]
MSTKGYGRVPTAEAEAEEVNGVDDTTLSASAPLLAPIEPVGLLGREVTLLSAVMLNIGQITGSGIYAVPGIMYNSVGSIGMLLIYWIMAPIFAFAGLSMYGELASMYPQRSGALVAYLEQAYPRPRLLVSTTFAITVILTTFSASNAIIFAQYFLSALNIPITSYSQNLTAVGVLIITVGSVALSTKWSLRAVNVLTVFKVISLVFIVLTGAAVLCGVTRIENPYDNFKDPFEGTSFNANALSTAFLKSNHAFIGWANAFNVMGEVRGKDPARTVRKAGRISLFLIAALFLFINVAYVAAVPREVIRESGQLIAVHFFRRVFGETGAKVFPLLVALSCFGNIIAVTVGHTRVIREVARQGLLPYPAFFTSIKPLGTPLGPVLLKGSLSILVILAVPAKDAFNFVLDFASYPNLFFQCAAAVSVWVLRRRRKRANLPRASLQAANSVVALYLVSCILLLVLPWVPPEPGHADVSFWYATYCVAGIALLLGCVLYYWVWIVYLPKRGGYEIVEEIEESSDGARNAKLVRRYKSSERQQLLE